MPEKQGKCKQKGKDFLKENTTVTEFICSSHDFTFCSMTSLQQVGNKWTCGCKTLENHISKATAGKGGKKHLDGKIYPLYCTSERLHMHVGIEKVEKKLSNKGINVC